MAHNAVPALKVDFDPLFQLNLILHMVLPRPPGAKSEETAVRMNVRPLFSEAGYELWCLPGAISLPDHVNRTFASIASGFPGSSVESMPNVSHSVKPDIVMRSRDQERILLLELKSAGFSEKSSDAVQLRSYLCISGNHAAVALGERADVACVTCIGYITFDGQLHMTETMDVVASEIRSLDLQTSEEYGHLSIVYTPEGIVVLRLPNEPILGEHPMHDKGCISVVSGENLGECRPLYLIPYYPGLLPNREQDKYARDSLCCRVAQHIFYLVGQGIGDAESVEFTVDGVARGAVFAVWDYVRDSEVRKHLLNRVIAPAIRRIVVALQKAGFDVVPDSANRRWNVALDMDVQRKLVRAMKAVGNTGDFAVPDGQLSLFDTYS